ncbi:hypothetical protein FB451DRAFT_508213 [Mycena latifolia]|nr:hypothetical protein FB451DRAFT_508213 [Mycena latifolia]
MSVAFLDLPTEILLRILEDPLVPTETLYFLALLCRRLHFTALPVYFARKGLTSKTQAIRLILREDRQDVLTALSTALFNFIPSLDTVTCIFPHPACTSILPFLEHVDRLERFIAGAPSLKNIALQLDTPSSICLSVGGDEALRAWTRHFGGLLNCILERQCMSLTVAHGGYFTRSYKLPPTNEYVRRQVSRLARRLRELASPWRAEPFSGTAEFYRVPGQGKERIEIPPPLNCSRASRLTTLHIQSAVLLLPPGLSWTLEALRTCPISSLTFSQVAIARREWGAVLLPIAFAATHLTTVSFFAHDYIRSTDIMCTDIVAFAGRVPGLTQLDILGPRAYGGLATADIPDLPKLTRLRAPPPFITHFLGRKDCLPVLHNLGICSPSASIEEIGQSLTTILRALDARNLAPVLSLEMNQVSGGSTSSLSTDARASLDRITGLEIVLDHFRGVEVREIISMVAIFRGVRQVTIRFERTLAFREVAVKLVNTLPPTEYLREIDVNGTTYPLGEGQLSTHK